MQFCTSENSKDYHVCKGFNIESHNTSGGLSTKRELCAHCVQMHQTLPELLTSQRQLTCTSKFRQKRQNWTPSVSHQRQLHIVKITVCESEEGRNVFAKTVHTRTQLSLPDTMRSLTQSFLQASLSSPINDRVRGNNL